MQKRVILLCFLSALFWCTETNQLRAQATASLSGTISDSSGGAVSEAVVQAKSIATSILRSTISDAQGRFSFSELAIGDYELQAMKPGFRTVVENGVSLTVGASPVVSFVLPVGQTQQTVNVEADVSQVETTSSAISNLVEQTQMRELPLNGRNFTQLMSLAPGVTRIPSQGNNRYGSQENYAVSGSRPQGQLFLLDDTNTAGYFNHGTGSGALGTALGIDAIDQFQTLTNTYSAQFGGSGAVINASTKWGTNSLRGSAYEFLRNSAIEARNVFDGGQVPPYRQNQFGATLGGAIKKDKAFFFLNYEGFRASKTISNVATVPDAQAHNYLAPNGAGIYVPVAKSTNPITAAAVQQVLSLYPLATSEILKSGLPTGTGFVTVPNRTVSYENYLVGRVDYNFSEKDSVFFRYVLDRASRLVDSLLANDPELDLTRNNYATIEERRIFSPTLVNLIHFSFVRNNESGNSVIANPGLQFYPANEGRPDGTLSPGSGISTIGVNSTSLPFYLIPNKFAVGDDVIWTHGAHSIKTGFSMERLQENTWANAGSGGGWTFANLTNFLQGVPTNFAGQLADTQYPSDAHKDWRERLFSMYVQDDWKVAKRVTINAGIRYEPTTNASWVNHVSLNLINAPYGNWDVVKNVHPGNVSLKNWDPRLGIAWDPFKDHKTSIRAGAGIFHDVVIAHYTPMYLAPPNLSGTQTLAQGAVFPFVLTNIPAGATIPTNGTVSCSPCTYYQQTRTPTTYQFNFNIQRELLPATVLTAGVVFSHSNFLQVSHDFNYPVPFTGADGNPVFGKVINGNIVANPRLNPSWNALVMTNGQGSSHYEGLQIGVNRRLTAGLQTQISYTFSKSMDIASGAGTFDGDTSIYNPTNFRSDYGLSTFDRRQTFSVSTVYQMPFHAPNAVLNKVVSGWQLSGLGTFVSGTPFTPTVGFASTGTGAYTPVPNVIAGCKLYPDNQTLNNWFNTACYTAPPIGEFGNLGRNTLIGPSLWSIDSSLSKEVRVPKISEQFAIQFRAEFFNILNHPSFAVPNAKLFTQGTNGAFVPNGGVNLITGTASQPRQIQFGLKVMF